MGATDRYASAVHSHDLSVKPGTTWSDTDVLGAAGLASRTHPLALSLQRLLSGDNTASRAVVEALAHKLVGKAWHGGKEQLKLVVAIDYSRAVLAWYRNGTCPACGGHGYKLIKGAPSLSDDQCGVCRGVGKRDLLSQFKEEHQDLVRWLSAEIDREIANVAPSIMASLAPRLTL